MARKVVWTQTARNQRRSILEYWTNRNKSNEYAKKLISITRNKLKLISQSPYLAREADFVSQWGLLQRPHVLTN